MGTGLEQGTLTLFCADVGCFKSSMMLNIGMNVWHQGHDVLFVPTYTPLKLESDNISIERLFYGGINVYLQQKSAIFRHLPDWLCRMLDTPSTRPSSSASTPRRGRRS